MKKYISLLACAALLFTACDAKFDDSIKDGDLYTNGNADFTTYVSVGNSLTAGFADNALYIQGQKNSYPNILAGQFALVGGGPFEQPLMNDNSGGLLLSGNQIADTRLVLSVGENGDPTPKNISGSPSTEIGQTLTGPFNNMGVPGAKSYHLVAPGYGNIAGVTDGTSNPYFVRFRSAENTTVLKDAAAQQPTFFSLWIGNNDVLGYATSGGSGVDQTGNLDPASYDTNDITDPDVFASVYKKEVDALMASASGGVLIGIPDVTSVPFFNTVPTDAIPLDEQTAGMLNAQFEAYNTQILPGLAQAGAISSEEATRRKISFQVGQNYVTLQDESLTDISGMVQAPPFNLDAQTASLVSQLRQANDTDLIPLPASSFLGTTVNNNPEQINGVSVPLADKYVLTASEQAKVAKATAKYNSVIKSLAQANNLVYVDAGKLLKKVADEGVNFDGGTITAEFATGGAFSLDGIHLTPRGYAFLANEILKGINQAYDATLPIVNIGNYSGGPAIGGSVTQ